MAGSYPDVPGPRIPYHLNGSVVVGYNEFGTPTTILPSPITHLNSEEYGWGEIGDFSRGFVAVGFPFAYDMAGVFIAGSFAGLVQTSSDSTNGMDGTWTTRYTYTVGVPGSDLPFYRSDIKTFSTAGVTWVRFWSSTGATGDANHFHNLHLYGTPSASSDRLELWHPTLNQSLDVTPAFFDWGDAARVSSQTKQFRVKNRSSTLTANAVVASLNVLYDSSDEFLNAHTFSLDGTTFTSTITLGNIAPGAITSVRYVRFSPSGSHPLSLWAGWVQAVAGSWT